jgi:ComF family protein
MTGWANGWRRLLGMVLPPRCLLCDAPGEGDLDLCAACAAELPRNASCCARCAEPLSLPAALCGRCQQHPPPWDAAWAPFRYDWPLDRLETRFKFAGNLACGRTLSRLWCDVSPPPEWPQAIVPVPLHVSRLRHRGYNQALELARPLAHALGIELQADALLRLRATEAQTELDAVARRRNVHDAFALREGASLPLHVAVLDDVMTTGATLAECARVLKRAGVTRVDAWALARAPSPRD